MADNNFEELLKALNEAGDVPDEGEEEEEGEGADGGGEAADAKIAAAAAEGCEGKPMAKSEGADAGEADLVDATELVKSLMERNDTLAGTLAKSMEAMTSALSKQGELIKSLRSEVRSLQSQGRGRKTVLSVVEKPDAGTLAKSEQDKPGISPDEFFAKANTMFEAEKISGKDLNTISVCMRMNQAVPADLVARVLKI